VPGNANSLDAGSTEKLVFCRFCISIDADNTGQTRLIERDDSQTTTVSIAPTMAEPAEKKRKRPEDVSGAVSKKKKVSISAAPASLPHTISVSSVVRPKFSPPVLGMASVVVVIDAGACLLTFPATTPGLVIPEDVQFHPYAKKEPNSVKKRKQSLQGPPKDLLLHSTSHHTLDYTAREDRPKGTESLLKHYVAVFDPASGELKVIEARKMVVRGLVRSRKAGDAEFAGLTEREVRLPPPGPRNGPVY